jgi:hypothetical protein
MSWKETALAMWGAGALATIATDNTIIWKTLWYLSWAADNIINNTWQLVDGVFNTTNSSSALLTPLVAVYWWVKVWEFLDEKIFKFENKYLKAASRIWWGLVWLSNMPIASVIWTWIAAWKTTSFIKDKVFDWTKALWHKWIPKKSPSE